MPQLSKQNKNADKNELPCKQKYNADERGLKQILHFGSGLIVQDIYGPFIFPMTYTYGLNMASWCNAT